VTFYGPHIRQTGTEALIGYLFGNALALGCAMLVCWYPRWSGW